MTVYSTAEVLQAAGDTARFVRGLIPLTITASVCGPAATCACAPGDNLAVHRLLEVAPEGSVLVVDAGGRTDCGHFGELAAMDAEFRDLQGLVIAGAIRDGGTVAVLGFPVFHGGFAPASCVKERVGSIGEVRVEPGDWVVGDDDGVVVVPNAIAESVLAEAEAKAATESEIRAAVRDGMPPLEAYERFGTF